MNQQKYNIKLRKQVNVLSCTMSCLLNLLEYQHGVKYSRKEELELFQESLNSKEADYDHTMGALILITKKYNVTIEVLIDSKYYFNYLMQQKLPNRIKLIHGKINKMLIKKFINKSPVILYLDKFYLQDSRINRYRFPHYVILHELNEKAEIIDPGDGKEKIIPAERLMKSIDSLRNRLYISPKLIRFI